MAAVCASMAVTAPCSRASSSVSASGARLRAALCPVCCVGTLVTSPGPSPLQSAFAGRQLAPFRLLRAEARRQAAPVCAGERRAARAAQCVVARPAAARRHSGKAAAAAAARAAGRTQLTISLPTRRAAATAEIKSMGVDKWNDTYYPTAADAANVNKQWCVAAAPGAGRGCLWLGHACTFGVHAGALPCAGLLSRRPAAENQQQRRPQQEQSSTCAAQPAAGHDV